MDHLNQKISSLSSFVLNTHILHSFSDFLLKLISKYPAIMAAKRKLQSHDLDFKLKAISRIRNGKEQQTKVARELGVHESTLRGWLKNEHKLRSFVDGCDTDVGLARKRTRVSDDPVLDGVALTAFCTKRADGVPLSGPIMQTLVSQLSQEIHGSDTPPEVSKGWVDRWKSRHGIRSIRIAGEIRSADTQAAEAFLPELQKVVEEEGLVPEQIFNCDETGLYWRMTPDRTLAARSDATSSHGHKQAKERVTVLLTCNWAGTHKPRPLVIGKSRSPRCFHHVNLDHLPVHYNHSKNAWMTSSIFEAWFHEHFVPAARRHLRRQGVEQRGILLLDNCPAHPPAESLVSVCGRFRVHYLPKNTTSKIQPLDQGIISSFKRHYRAALIHDIVKLDTPIVDFLKAMTIKDACYKVGTAWGKIAADHIKATWDKALGNPFDHPCPDSDDEEEDFYGFSAEDVQAATDKLGDIQDLIHSWSTVDDDAEVSPPQSVADFVAASKQPQPEEPEEPEEPEDDTPLPPAYNFEKGLEAAEYLLGLWEQTGRSLKVAKFHTEIMDIKVELLAAKKQKSLNDYIKKP